MQPPNPLWANRWQVIRGERGTVTVLCTHRYEIAARACAAWRDLCTDAAGVGQPIRIWHDYRRTPDSPYAQGGRIR